MTGHYIESTPSNPNDWELKSEQLAFTHIEGNHSGANLGGILIHVIDRYGIRRKASLPHPMIDVSLSLISWTHQMGWFTADNASNNFSAIREVAKQVNADLPGSDWDAKQHYVR